MPTFTLRKAPPSRIPSVTVTAPDLDSALREARFLGVPESSTPWHPEVDG